MTEPSNYPVLQDRYQIEDLLGRQSGRRTFLAFDRHHQQYVIIKVLLFGPDFVWDDLKLFEREAAVLKSLNLTQIPQYLDSFEVELAEGKGFALVQSYIAAPSLQQWIDRGRTFAEDELKSIAGQLLAILADLHARQPAIVHRDIKPSNILLTEDRSAHQVGTLYLVDFGSVQTAIKEGTRTVVGTYGYMPPEQFGGITTPAADIYAVGATLIHLTTGITPSELPQKAMRLKFEDRISLPPHLVRWLQKSIDPDVDERWRDANHALVALNSKTAIVNTPPGQVPWMTEKPHGSKIRIVKTDRVLTVSMRSNTHWGWLGLIPVALYFGWSFRELLAGLLTGLSSTMLWTGGIFSVFSLLYILLIFTFLMGTIDRLFGCGEIEISTETITYYRVWFGYLRLPLGLAPRRHIRKISLIPLLEVNSNRLKYKIVVYAGAKELLIQGEDFSQVELEWVCHELSQWLDIPIDRATIRDLKEKPRF